MPLYSAPDHEPSLGRQGVVVGFCLVIAILALNLPSAPRQAIGGGIRGTAMRPFVEVQKVLVRIRVRTRDADLLRAENDSLIAILLGSRGIAEESSQLRALLGLKERLTGSWAPAVVMRSGTLGSESTFMIASSDGTRFEVGASVVTGDGLLGRVQQGTSGGTAVGIDWTHPEFRASAMSADGSAIGMVRVLRGSLREEDRLELYGTDYHMTLHPGTEIRTNGGFGIFPRGIPLGFVEGISLSEAGFRRNYQLRAAVIPAGVTHVLVAVAGVDGSNFLSSAWPGSGETEEPMPSGGTGGVPFPRDSVEISEPVDGSGTAAQRGGAGGLLEMIR